MTLAATFFGGLNVAADTVGRQALDAQLVNTPVDVNLYPGYSGIGYYSVGPYRASSYYNVTNAVKGIDGVTAAESTATAYSYNVSYPVSELSRITRFFTLTLHSLADAKLCELTRLS